MEGHVRITLKTVYGVWKAKYALCKYFIEESVRCVECVKDVDRHSIVFRQGKQRAEQFIQDFILTQLIGKDLFEMWPMSNPMGLLIDILHKQGRSDPEPR